MYQIHIQDLDLTYNLTLKIHKHLKSNTQMSSKTNNQHCKSITLMEKIKTLTSNNLLQDLNSCSRYLLFSKQELRETPKEKS